MRAFCYCRVSTEEQSTDDHYSLANQEKKAKDYAKVKEWQVVRVHKDMASRLRTWLAEHYPAGRRQPHQASLDQPVSTSDDEDRTPGDTLESPDDTDLEARPGSKWDTETHKKRETEGLHTRIHGHGADIGR